MTVIEKEMGKAAGEGRKAEAHKNFFIKHLVNRIYELLTMPISHKPLLIQELGRTGSSINTCTKKFFCR